MVEWLRNLRLVQQEEGQGLVEYALILILVAIAVVIALTLLGPTLGNIYNDIVSSIPAVGLIPLF